MSRARNVANPTQITIPVTVSANLTSNAAVTVGNTTVNSFISSSTLRVGNTSVNAFINSTAVFVPTEVDVGANVTLTTTGFSVGNSTVNTSITSTALTTVSNTVTIGTGTYFAANGRVGIGTSTPGNKLVISEPTSTSYQLNLNNSGGYSNGNYSGILFQQGASTETGWIRLNHQDNGDTSLSFGTRLTTVGERMRIANDGTTTIRVDGVSVFNVGQSSTFTGGRGRVVVSADTSRVTTYTGQFTVFAASGQTAGALVAIASDNSEVGNTAWKHFQGRVYGSNVADTITINIFGNGNITNTNNSYGQISDIKTKQDISDATSQWNDIKNIRVRKFRFKNNPTGFLQIGVVAQELEEVSPGLVEEIPDYEEVTKTREVEKTCEIPAVLDEEGNEVEPARTETYTETEEYTENVDLGTTTKSVKYSVLYMKAVKALQEAMNRIETLEAKVNALENN